MEMSSLLYDSIYFITPSLFHRITSIIYSFICLVIGMNNITQKKKKTMQEIVNQREYVIESGKFFALAK